jgi:glycosyltransferase involved in cell wall biosynthesis
MRIVYIHQYFSTRAGATGTRSYEFARYLVDRGHSVTMITGTAWLEDIERAGLVTRTEVDGIDVVAIGVRYHSRMGFVRRMWSFAAFMLAASRVARRERCDVVFASSTPLTVGIPGWLAARKHRVPFVFEVRDLWPEAPIQLGVLTNPLLKSLALWLEGFLYAKADHVVALSPGMVDGVAARGVPRERISMIPNCADTHLFSPGPKDDELVARWGLEGAFVAAYIGAMGPANDLGQVIEAARIVAEREGAEGRRTVFLLIGDGKERPLLEARTRELGLGNVVWADPVPKADVPRILRTADVALVSFADLPILRTNSPNKAFDALAAGRPVVVDFGGWVREMLEETGAGIGTKPGDPSSLAGELISLRDDPARRERMGVAAREVARSRFDRMTMAAKLEDLLEQMVREVRQA